MNDRTLRDSFDITAASEMMAIFCLAKDYDDLRLRVDSILLAKNTKGKNIYVKDLKVTGAVIALLRDAMLPNLVQTTSGALAVVHGGPFANIAHGCNSVLATRAAMAYSDICVTEAGFGADLGAVKFLDIKMRSLNEGKKKGEYIWPKFIVIVATVKSGRLQGTGFDNLKKHIENMSKFGSEVVVAVNRFKDDGEEELKNILETVALCGARGFITDFYAKGENGGDDIARYIKNSLSQDTLLKTKYLYKDEDSIKEKIEKVAKEIFGAKKVELSKEVKKKILEIEKSGFYHLPICIAKNQYSFTGDAKLLGAPTGHTLHVGDITLRAGAGFITIFAGTIYTMPGLSRSPAAENIDVDKNGCIINLK
jgi:formate--tetrahydrofolate ligase